MTLQASFEVTTPTDTDVVMTRVFAAPRPLLWDAWTNPKLLQQWLLGPDGWTMPICEVDLRVGGAYRYVWQRGEHVFSSSGRFLEIAAPGRLVCTERMNLEGAEPITTGPEAINTLTLSEAGGRTTVTQQSVFPSKEIRDAVVESGMAGGVAKSFDRLEGILG